jgi:hypothetical protein
MPYSTSFFSNGELIECHPYIDSGTDVTLIPLYFGMVENFNKD